MSSQRGQKDVSQPNIERQRRNSDKTPESRSTAQKHYTPTSPPGVRFHDDPADKRTGRSSREKNRSRSPSMSSRSPSRERRRQSRHSPSKDSAEEDKPWFKKKTLWTTVATLATVASLVPTAVSAQASTHAATASQRAARASSKSAKAVERSAEASIKSAEAGIRSAHAAQNSAMAQGHQDEFGRYVGPPLPRQMNGSVGGGSSLGSSRGSVMDGMGHGGVEGRRPLRQAIEHGSRPMRHSTAGRRQW
ncbi:hypothetical protein EJ08DRAFT_412655 [Tothia fuscella]|uniref:Uncharacterized protein n=1 Tax=Tothia fuscella TaxID=1048955 RepID=A0A9P4NK05_9PEZI|nr:hypothetical protein EJ08DRAFT_412655 [Tothia fuscella]